MTENSAPHLYYQRMVDKYDHDRYLTILYSPAEKRSALFALYAFNYEISKIREVVSEPMLGEIRLQWWREAIEGIFQGDMRNHEVIPTLSAAITQNEICRDSLMTIIDGRAQDLYDEALKNNAELEKYLSQTAGKLSCLAVHILGQRDIDDLAQRLGIAWGYLGIIRAVPYHLSLKKNYIPADLMNKYGLSHAKFLSPDGAAETKSIIQALCHQAQQHLDHITANKGRIETTSRSAFLLTSLARSYLQTIKKADFNPFVLAEKKDALPRQWRLFISAMFNHI
ncbi:Phytoene synthase [hydrothermal vent metagenome]|uniref:Phytoene synthase n=1 Tax=hydrothermal vent metagenome TaxID=652676 RepID=A0A3B1B2Q4_9ZZZZ